MERSRDIPDRPSLAELVSRWREWASRPALVDGIAGETVTYGELLGRVEESAAAIDEAFRGAAIEVPGVVGIVGRGSLRDWVDFLGGLLAGKVVVPLGSDTKSEVRLAAAGVGLVRTVEGRWEARSAMMGPVPDRVARLARKGHAGLVIFTSGSTGEPRGALHDLDSMLGRLLGRRLGQPLRVVALLRHDHIGGVDVVLRGLTGGSALVLPAEREPGAIARLVEARDADVLPASPSFLSLLLLGGHAGEGRMPSLRRVPWGAEPMPATLLARLRRQLPKASFEPRFGTTETGPLAVAPAPGDDPCAFLAQGREETWRVVEGELQLRRPEGFLGYLDEASPDPGDTDWQRTGDAAEEIPGGFRVLGRLVEQVNVGGRKVRPAAVEAALLAHPAVIAARVEGRPHALLGSELVAQVQLVDASAATADLRAELRAHARSRLQPYEVPTRIEWSGSLVDPGRVKLARR